MENILFLLILGLGLYAKIKILKSFTKPIDKKRNPW